MTVSTTITKERYPTNGVTVDFPFTFYLTDESQVFAQTIDSDGNEVQYYDFTVSISSNSNGGTLTTLDVLDDVDLLIYRSTPITQETDYPRGSRFPAASHEAALDKLTQIVQEQQEELDRAVKSSIGDDDPIDEDGIIELINEGDAKTLESANYYTDQKAINISSSVGWNVVGGFEAGAEINNTNDVLDYAGSLWRTNAALPYTTDGSTPDTDSADWFAVSVAELPGIARSLNSSDSEVIYSTDTTTLLDFVYYIYDGSSQVTWVRPDLDGLGETIVSITGNQLTTSANTYTMSMATTKNAQVNVIDFGAVGDGVTDSTANFESAQAVSENIYVPSGNFICDTASLTARYYGEGLINSVPVANPAQGLSNTMFGFDAGKNFAGDNETSDNTLIGRGCGRELTTGVRNTAIGQGVFSGNTLTTAGPEPMTGSNNCGMGFHALKKMEGGSFNVGIGTDAGNEIISGGSNTFVGGSSGQQVTIGFDNSFYGRSAGLRIGLDASSGDPDSFIPLNSEGNSAFGRDALRNGYDCNYNSVFGCQAMRGTKDESDLTGNMTGEYNVVMGYRAMFTNPLSASFNVVIGEEAGREIEDNNNNVIIGAQAGRDAITGDGSIILGALSSRGVSDIDNLFSVANQSGLPFMSGIMGAALDVDNYLRVDGNFSAQTGSSRTCGTSGRPWTTVFADNNVIQPSDARLKTEPEPISNAMFTAWGNARKKIKMWKWLSRGDDARYHIGPIAQELFKCFTDEGIDPFDFGFACSDLVYEEKNIYDGDNLVSVEDVPVIDPETGSQMIRYSIRQNELFMLEIAYQAWLDEQ